MNVYEVYDGNNERFIVMATSERDAQVEFIRYKTKLDGKPPTITSVKDTGLVANSID